MTRRCARPACSDSAAATLTYRYASSEVWMEDLADRPEPHAYDLCARHANRLTVPAGWLLDDRRSGDLAVPAGVPAVSKRFPSVPTASLSPQW